MLLNSLVEYFLETNSSQAVDILSSVREPHDKVRTLNGAYAGFVTHPTVCYENDLRFQLQYDHK